MEKIKNAFLGFACVALLAGAVESSEVSEKSGVFIGAQVGFATTYGSASVKTDISSAEAFSINLGMLYGARLGYQQYFNAYNGLRLYGTFGYSALFKYGANIDYLLNFSKEENSWGLFIGGGYEWVQSSSLNNLKDIQGSNVKQNGAIINAGFSKTIKNHNRIDFGVTIPLYKYADFETTGPVALKYKFSNPFDLYLAYNYSF
ncbi:outer membrane beta-barrel protein [Helicobacter sp. 11S02596-1]|uniref:outer membrane beta-barrel protein n=1 Tax=Helicobacter sp. 11S02596-1 TaxID=1476194 RepID=UPI000BD465A1|nr:outer membrane beta-barrel protein [Helicobacter sp. 11S02596-1]PAF42091.1 hypothetical protein BJI48_07200 [Helicobacter sp. 11S02596-1]